MWSHNSQWFSVCETQTLNNSVNFSELLSIAFSRYTHIMEIKTFPCFMTWSHKKSHKRKTRHILLKKTSKIFIRNQMYF